MVQEALPYVDVAVGNLDECETAVGEREPYAAARRAARPRGSRWRSSSRARRACWPTTARRTSRCRRCRSTSSTASAQATRSAGRCATPFSLDGISSGACGSATRPVRSSRGGWRARTPCRLRTRSRPSSSKQGTRRPSVDDHRFRDLVATRVERPGAIAEAAARRRRPTSLLGDARPADDDRRGPPGPRRARRGQPPVRHGRSRRPARPAGAGPVAARRERRARHPGHPRGPAAARRAGRQGRHRLDEPRRPGRHGVRAGRPVHRATTRRPSRTPASRAARCSPASTRTTRPRSRRSSRARDAVSDLAAAPADGHGRAVHLPPLDGRVRNELTADAMVRANAVAAGPGHDLGLHLAEGADRRRDGAGDGRHHAARVDPGRRGRARISRPRSRTGRRRSRCRRCRAWSSAGRCSTRRATTSRRPSTRRWGCCDRRERGDGQAGDRHPGRRRGRGRLLAVDHAGAGGLGLQQLQGPGARGRRHAHLRHRRGRVGGPAADRVVHRGLPRCEDGTRASPSPDGAGSSPGSPTSPTCPATRRPR